MCKKSVLGKSGRDFTSETHQINTGEKVKRDVFELSLNQPKCENLLKSEKQLLKNN